MYTTEGDLKERIERVKKELNLTAGSVVLQLTHTNARMPINPGTLMFNDGLQKKEDDAAETCSKNRATILTLKKQCILFLEAHCRLHTLNGSGVIKLNGHTLTVETIDEMRQFTGRFVGPGELQFASTVQMVPGTVYKQGEIPCEKISIPEGEVYEIRRGVLRSCLQGSCDTDAIELTVKNQDNGSAMLLEKDVRIGALKGDGMINLKDHTLTVTMVEGLREFTGSLIGPGKLQFASAANMEPETVYKRGEIPCEEISIPEGEVYESRKGFVISSLFSQGSTKIPMIKSK